MVNDNLIAMSYEDDQQCFQISKDQGNEDCHSGFSCFEMLFQEENNHLNKIKQKLVSPLSEDEIDQLLKGQVTAQNNVGQQCAHGQEGVGETFSSFENIDSIEITLLISKKIMFSFMKMIILSCLIILKIVFYLRMT